MSARKDWINIAINQPLKPFFWCAYHEQCKRAEEPFFIKFKTTAVIVFIDGKYMNEVEFVDDPNERKIAVVTYDVRNQPRFHQLIG